MVGYRIQRTVWSLGVVTDLPVLNDPPSISQAANPMNREALVAECAVVPLERAVLHGPAGVDEIPGHLVVIGPGITHLRGALRIVIQGDAFGRGVHRARGTADQADAQRACLAVRYRPHSPNTHG